MEQWKKKVADAIQQEDEETVLELIRLNDWVLVDSWRRTEAVTLHKYSNSDTGETALWIVDGLVEGGVIFSVLRTNEFIKFLYGTVETEGD